MRSEDIRTLATRSRGGDADALAALCTLLVEQHATLDRDSLLTAFVEVQREWPGLTRVRHPLEQTLFRLHLLVDFEQDRELWWILRTMTCTTMMMRGDWASAIPLLWSLVQRAPDAPDLVDEAMALSSIGYVLTQVGRPEKALSYIERALRLGGRPRRVVETTCDQVHALCRLGRVEEAVAAAATLDALPPGDARQTAVSRLTRFVAAAAAGDEARALELDGQLVGDARLSDDEQALRLVYLARLHEHAGRDAAFRRACDEAWVRIRQQPIGVLVSDALRLRTRALAATGDTAEIIEMLDEYEAGMWSSYASAGSGIVHMLERLERADDAPDESELLTLNRQLRRALEALDAEATARRAAEEQVRRSAMMDAVGRLAAGLAHDLNNLLTVSFSCIDLLARRVDGPGQRIVDELDQTTGRAAALVQRLMSLSRRSTSRTTTVDLGELIERMEPLFRHALTEGIALEVDVFPDVVVRCEPLEIEQVLLNLVFNARDAVGSSGTVRIDLERGEGPGGRPVAKLRVTDDGHGIAPEHLERLFEPFFTTREGHGHGLGLAVCRQIVEACGGTIEASSHPGHGATFCISVPVAEREERVTPEGAARIVAEPQGDVVLVVEDEAAVRSLVVALLEEAGFTVLQAVDGTEGLAVWEAEHGRIDVVVSDIVMPGCSGVEIARAVLERSRVPVLLMTGYADDDRLPALLENPRVDLLAKPFKPQALLDALGALTAEVTA